MGVRAIELTGHADTGSRASSVGGHRINNHKASNPLAAVTAVVHAPDMFMFHAATGAATAAIVAVATTTATATSVVIMCGSAPW